MGWNVRRTVFALLLVGLAGIASCVDDSAAPTGSLEQAISESIEVTVTLPVNVDPRRVGLGINGDVYVADRARLVSSNRTWMPVTTNTGTQRTEVGADTSIGTVIGFSRVFLRSRSVVNGDAISKGVVERQTGATVAGRIVENVQTPQGVVDTVRVGWRASVPVASNQTVMIEPDQTRVLGAGSYGNVFVKSRAVLDLSSARLFRFKSLMVEPGASIRVDAGLPTELYVDDGVTFRGSITAPGASAPPPVTIAMFGTGQMSFESTIRALMIAPNGKVVLGGMHRDFFGAVFGRAVELRPDVVLHHMEFNLPIFTPGGPRPDSGADLPDVPDPFAVATAHCGPRDKLAMSAWPMPGFCPTQIALSPFNGTRTNELRWLAIVADQPLAQPVMGENGNAHLVTQQQRLTTLSADGHVRWAANLSGVAAAAPTVIRNGEVVVPLQSGSIQVLTRAGTPHFTAEVCASRPTAVNVDPDGNFVVGCAAGSVELVSPLGNRIWSAPTSSGVQHVPTVGNPGVLLAVSQTQLMRLGRQDGSVLWARNLPASPLGPAALVRDRIYVVTANSRLTAFTVDGSERWQASLGAAPAAPLAISPWGLVLVPLANGELVAIAADTGAISHRVSLGSGPVSQVIVGSDGIAYATTGNQVVAVVPSDGRVLWTYNLEAASRGIALSDQGLILAASAADRVLAIGSSPHWTVGGDGGASSSPPRGLSPAGCEAQKLATGRPTCDPGGDGWADRDRIATGGTNPNDATIVGQSTCVSPTPPAGLTSQGLGGFGYLADEANGTGQLVFNPPQNAPEQCRLRFCEQRTNPDGTVSEVEINLPFSRVAQNPAELPQPTTCSAAEGSGNCPVDPGSNTHRRCKNDSECGAGEVCAVFCNNAACQDYETACGRRLQCAASGFAAEPSGPFSEGDPSTWPCEDLRECADTDPVFGATGDPDLRKAGSLEQRNAPRAEFVASPPQIVPAGYRNYAETLVADPCNSAPVGNTANSQIDSRSGSSGNRKWGLFIEPDVSQKYSVELSDVFGLPSIELQGIGSFRAGAFVWGKEIEIISAKAEALLATCNGRLTPSLKILGNEIKEWQSFASDELPPAPEPPSDQEVLNCENARNSLDDRLANLRKALYDARAAWDAFRRNNSVAPQALCARTRAILGNVDPGGCTVESARAWIRRYRDLVRETETFIDTQYAPAAFVIAARTEGAVAFAPATGGPFADIGATTHFPVGPVVLTLEIEVVGDLDVSGRLSYSMGLVDFAQGHGGPNLRVEAAPGAHVDAFVFVGAGFPGVSVGIEGQLRLIGVSAPVHAAVGLSRTGYLDPRPFESSGLFGFVSGGPGLLRRGTMQKWNAHSSYGAGVVLDTLSGRINLAARIRLLFFKKTFRKQIASWDGLTKTYEFVGSLGKPLTAEAQSDVMLSPIPFPEASDQLEAAFNVTPIGIELPVTTLGGTSAPGACNCAILNAVCTTSADCCAGYQCRSGRCGVPAIPQ